MARRFASAWAALLVVLLLGWACSSSGPPDGAHATGGTNAAATGGSVGSGGAASQSGDTGGTPRATGGTSSSGGASATGGSSGTAGQSHAGGAAGSTHEGGTSGAGGAAGSGGTTGTGGAGRTGGTTGSGGNAHPGGGAAGSGSRGASDACQSSPALSNGTSHCSSSLVGTTGAYSWMVWSDGPAGCLITYGTTGAFSATWNNSGDFLARLGLQWNSTQTYDQLGTISTDFNETKSGTAGDYSYIGIYGWSENPMHEFYIVEDSFNVDFAYPA
jgi:endo-1,4-beta-xylanase